LINALSILINVIIGGDYTSNMIVISLFDVQPDALSKAQSSVLSAPSQPTTSPV